MKSLLLLRHAKSSWKDPELADHDRPLNKRGKRNAPRMGEFIAAEGLLPDLLVSSTAVRAQQTARLVADHCGYGDPILTADELYPTTVPGCVSVLKMVRDDVGSVLLVAHNPGLEEFAEHLCGQYERMQTCVLMRFAVLLDRWSDFTEDTRAELQNVWRPREAFGE